MTARHSFDTELGHLNNELIRMGGMIEEAIGNSIKAFKNHDKELARQVIEYDRIVDEIEKTIDSRCLSLILRQQPVARDLRAITTALKMVTDMERIADAASDIAEITLRLEGEHIYTVVEHIPQMAEIASSMVNDAVAAFVREDVALAKQTMERDDEVDSLFDAVKEELLTAVRRGSENSDKVVDFLMIAKYLERIGDHAVNICEWVEFHETGEYKRTRIL